MLNAQRFEKQFKTKTGWLCLDFANTVDWHASAAPEETLRSYRELVSWSQKVAIATPETADALLALSEKEPAAAQETLKRAIDLREAIYHILADRANGRKAAENDLAVLNKALGKVLANLKLGPRDGPFIWEWAANPERLASVLEPVVWSAAQLLTSEALERVGQCQDERGCGWLFWDNSRNRTRRWCDMQDCGNRAKSRRHYRKAHAGGG